MESSASETAFLGEVVANAMRFRARPDLWTVLAKSTAESLRHFLSTAPDMRYVLKDTAAYMLALHAVYVFHSEPETLTASQLKNHATGRKLCSKGRAAAIVAHMLKRGLLTAETSLGRGARLTPGPVLENYFREELRGALETLTALSPAQREGLARMTDPAFFTAYIRTIQPFGDAMSKVFGDGSANVRLFTLRDAGWPILLDLVQRCPGFPPTGSMKLSVAALAQRFSVSRPHILKLLTDANAAGLLDWSPETRQVAITPAMIDEIAYFEGGALAVQETVVARALAA